MNDIPKLNLVAFVLYCCDVAFDRDVDVDELDLVDMRIDFSDFMKGLNEKHFGDCTNDSCPCLRCHSEEYLKNARLLMKAYE